MNDTPTSPSKNVGLALGLLMSLAKKDDMQLAGELGVEPRTVQRWKQNEEPIPYTQVAALRKALKTPIPRAANYIEFLVKNIEPEPKRNGVVPPTQPKPANAIEPKPERNGVTHPTQPKIASATKPKTVRAKAPIRIKTDSLLATVRTRAGWSQTELGERMGVSSRTVASWEAGIINRFMLVKLYETKIASDDEMASLALLAWTPRLEALDIQVDTVYEEEVYKESYRRWVKKWLEDYKTNPQNKAIERLTFPALDLEWLQEQPVSPKVKTALLLESLREHKGISQQELGEKMKLSNSTIAFWEAAKNPTDPFQLTKLYKELTPTDEEMFTLTRLVRPELEEAYIRAQLEAKQIDYLVFPALNPKWLEGQPAKLKAGLLLSALRERRDISQVELGKRGIGDPQKIEKWELGNAFIPIKWLPDLYTALTPSVDEMVQLTLLVWAPTLKNKGLTLTEAYIKEQLKTNNTDYLAFPALDPAWLQEQPKKKQGGLLIAALRESSGWLQKELAAAITVEEGAIEKWENNRNYIPKKHIDSLSGEFKLMPGFDPVYFRNICEQSNAALIESRAMARMESTHLGEVKNEKNVREEIKPKSPKNGPEKD